MVHKKRKSPHQSKGFLNVHRRIGTALSPTTTKLLEQVAENLGLSEGDFLQQLLTGAIAINSDQPKLTLALKSEGDYLQAVASDSGNLKVELEQLQQKLDKHHQSEQVLGDKINSQIQLLTQQQETHHILEQQLEDQKHQIQLLTQQQETHHILEQQLEDQKHQIASLVEQQKIHQESIGRYRQTITELEQKLCHQKQLIEQLNLNIANLTSLGRIAEFNLNKWKPRNIF